MQLDPTVWELPGAMPEIVPSPDFDPANIDRKFTERSMALQAWGTYGILWPVVHYQLGVSPDVGRKRFTVVPQIPSGQFKVAGRDIRVGTGLVNVTALRGNNRLATIVRQDRRHLLTVGAAAAQRQARQGGQGGRPQGVLPGAVHGPRPRGPGQRWS